MNSESIKYEENKIRIRDGTELFYRYWRPPEPKAVIIGVHGYAEHSGRYMHVGEFFAKEGFGFYIHDHRGHGRSGGERGYVNKFQEFIDDLDEFLEHVKTSEGVDKVFLLGHSMGGLIGIIYAIQHPEKLKGLVTSGAGLKTGIRVSGVKIAFMKLISTIKPTYRPDIKIDPNALTNDETVNRAYSEDPLVFKQGTIKLLLEMIKAMEWANQNADKLKVPILMMHGANDEIVPPEASKEFFEKVPIEDKQLIILPERKHEIFNDINKEEALNKALEWIKAHL